MAVTQQSQQSFEQTWQNPTGFPGFLSEVNNQPIGQRFMITAAIFFMIGGVLALLMRIQLTVSENDFLGPQVYNQLFTMHGSTMMYLFAVPFIEGLALWALPMMLGSRDVAYPRLTAFGYWTYLFGGILFYSSFIFGPVPDVGWFGYTPLSTSRFTGVSTDFWLLGLSLVEIGGITAAVEIVATILKFRAPGMSLNRMPLFVWAMLIVGFMIIFAFTTLLTATILLELDRAMQTCFFDTQRGGSSLLWQHLFWFFGHPEVYIIFLPATGVISMIVVTFSQRRIVGYTLIAVAILVTGFLSFGLWVHHMFTTGLPELSMTFFTAASLMIAIATGIQIFAWIATMWGSRPSLKVPLLYVLGFMFIFVLGGLTGVMIAIVPFDWQVHDSYFIVAHFHYVLLGGVIFPLLGGMHYWLPKMTGRMLREDLGIWSFWLAFLGFNFTFFPMHIMGLLGMPRRVYTYPAILQVDGYNIVATVAAFVLAAGFVLFLFNFYLSLRNGQPAGDDPWHGDSLEWSLPSPPTSYTFYQPPLVKGRHALWDANKPVEETEDIARVREELAGQPEGWRATLVTDALEARPQAVQWLPGPSYTPLFAALGVLVAVLGLIILPGAGEEFYLWTIAGSIFTAGAVARWLWPTRKVLDMMRESDLPQRTGLPIFTTGTQSTAWWGIVGTVAIVGVIFAVLFYSYFYLRLYSDEWPQGNILLPDFYFSLPAFLLLAGSAGPQFWSSTRYRAGDKAKMLIGLTAALGFGVLFLGLEIVELSRQEFAHNTNAYGSVFHVTSWATCLAVLTGLALNAALLLRLRREEPLADVPLALQVQIANMYWYFLAVVGALVFAVLYLSPLLL